MERTLAGTLALALTAVGALAVAAPKLSAGQYGLPTDDPGGLGFVRATGARDMLLGLLVFGVIDDAPRLRRALGIVSLAGLADAAALGSVRGWRPQHAIHLSGFAALALAALAVRDRTD